MRRFLDERLGAGDANRHFVEAVIQHLGAGPTAVLSQMEAAEQVVRIVRAPYNTDSSAALLRYPELMASIFQNADLLDPGDAAAVALARTVMKAMEGLHPGSSSSTA